MRCCSSVDIAQGLKKQTNKENVPWHSIVLYPPQTEFWHNIYSAFQHFPDTAVQL